jgi:hypothetical protein
MQMHIQVVNINNLGFTKNIISDLMKQTHQIQLTVIDQGSTESGTKEYLRSLSEVPYIGVEIIRNDKNVDLNRLWNRLYYNSKSDYLCFLNNDVRISSNFVEDTINIFEKEWDVGAVVHATNHPEYQSATKLNYVISEKKQMQGWDFTMRREVYTPIPNDLKVFGGDDWLFTMMYRKMRKLAVALSSPIIHYNAQSRKYYKGDRNVEAAVLRALGIERLHYISRYTNRHPKFDKIKEE